jgi:molecular chaperone GrpE (heat shock protein)
MTDSVTPTINKWPFLLGDALLVALAGVFALRGSAPPTLWQGALCLAATACGAWFCVLPFLKEYQAALKLRETDALATAVPRLEELTRIKDQIGSATAQWQSLQDTGNRTVGAAREITDRMHKELGDFCTFLQQANDKEKAHLRLEVEKLHRAEREWLQATVHILDHVFALQTAGNRSGQPALVAQLTRFQLACREVVRRLGLVDFAPAAGDSFDSQMHQTAEEGVAPDAAARITETLAAGYTFQGEVVRRALVRIQAGGPGSTTAP